MKDNLVVSNPVNESEIEDVFADSAARRNCHGMKKRDAEEEMILDALGAANAITRTPITEENIKEARVLIDSVEKLRNRAIEDRLKSKK